MIHYIILFIFLVTWLCNPGLTQQKSDDILQESVSVVNIEVPVRVFHRGEPVDNLTKADFVLYEDGKKQTINGFFIKKKTIDIEELELETSKKTVQTVPPRYFVLIFNISEFNQKFKNAIDHIFSRVLRQSDELLVFANNKQLHFQTLQFKKKNQSLIEKVLDEESKKARTRMASVIRKIEVLGEHYLRIWIDHPQSIFAIQDYLKTWTNIWNEYKRMYLTPDIQKFFYFARHLENIRKEKWVINFCQMELFPKLKKHGTLKKKIRAAADAWTATTAEWGRILHSMLDKLEQDMTMAKDFPISDISKLFYKVNATFHTVFIPTSIETISSDIEYQSIANDLENSLRDITRKTGGELITTTDLIKAMNTISQKEDIFYILTYCPKNPEKKGKIRIKLPNRRFQVIYDNNIRADYINEFFSKREKSSSTIQIKTLDLRQGNLVTTIDQFQKLKGRDNKAARIRLRIRLLDKKNKVLFDQSKTLLSKKNTIKITIPFKTLNRGEYFVIVDATDLNTGKSATRYIQPRII